MANDKRLPYPPGVAVGTQTKPLPTAGGIASLGYPATVGGALECWHEWLPHEMTHSFDPVNGNVFNYPVRIRSTDYFKTIPSITGWAEGPGVNAPPAGSLKRRLPITDPEGMGTVATRIVSVRFESDSDIKPGPLVYDGPNNPSAIQPRRQPSAPGVQQSDLFKDDCYTPPDVFNFKPLEGGGIQEAIKTTRYVKLVIEFRHVFYPLITDDNTQSGGNPFGASGAERYRFMWAQFDPNVEVIMSKTLTLKFGVGAVDENGASITGQQCGLEAPYLRPTGTLLVHWIQVPVEAVAMLFNKFEYFAGGGFDRPLYGTVNQADFKIGLFNTVRNYAAGTLLFLGCRPEPRFYSYGGLCYDLTYVFGYKGWGQVAGGAPATARGWNYFMTGRSADPQPVVRQDGSKPYIESEFEQLFRWD